jgi:hypothetical protein
MSSIGDSDKTRDDSRGLVPRAVNSDSYRTHFECGRREFLVTVPMELLEDPLSSEILADDSLFVARVSGLGTRRCVVLHDLAYGIPAPLSIIKRQ